jgi:hypothetical protein
MQAVATVNAALGTARCIAAALPIVLAACAGNRLAVEDGATELAEDEARGGVHRVLLRHDAEPDRRVELFWTPPDGEGPWPAILYVHGHQPGQPKPGASLYVERGWLQATADRGLLAAAVSQPGYGGSDGPADYCGPRSQGAVATALAYLRAHPLVHRDRIVLYGYSRGATVAAMVATRDADLGGVILPARARWRGSRPTSRRRRAHRRKLSPRARRCSPTRRSACRC